METDHIVPGDDRIENAIPVCFECHAEIHGYNDEHPRGRKFTPEELQEHKRQWLEICRTHPEALLLASRQVDVGPLQALIDELGFNARIAREQDSNRVACLFHEQQFRRAIEEGAIAVLRDDLKSAVIDAYAAMGSANQDIIAAKQQQHPEQQSRAMGRAQGWIREAQGRIDRAQSELLRFLGSER